MVDFTLSEIDVGIVIVEKNKGSKVMELSKEKGISGGTIFLGTGTANRNLFDYLGLNDKKKEIVLMVGQGQIIKEALDYVSEVLNFSKANHGIAFVVEVNSIVGSSSCKIDEDYLIEEEDFMYKAIYTIVERGLGDEVIDAAQGAGSMGGTVIHARGSGIHERQKVFNMTIEPEKEIVLILSKTETANGIVKAIKENLKIDQPGNGIIFVTDVKETYGIRD